MRCANCGLPLSPARTHCPRCGTPARTESKAPDRTNAPGNAGVIQQMDFAPVQTHLPQQSWRLPASSTAFSQGSPFEMQIGTIASPQNGKAEYNKYTPFPDAFPLPPATSAPPVQFPGGANTATATFLNGLQQRDRSETSGPGTEEAAQPNHLPQQLQPLMSPGNKQSAKMRLTVSASCVLVGGLLLVFVYFMARGLPGTMVASGATKSSLSTMHTATALPAITPTATTAPSISPTATYPGQKYIDSAQMASSVNIYSAQATQPATTFKVNQLVYVTFAVHTGGVGGAACLMWYLNHTVVASYGLGVRPTTNAYSYARLTSPGSAYVEIYWASTRACTDKVLAQHVDFTVSA